MSEDEYVEQEAEITRSCIRLGLKDHDGQRMRRSEHYARQRYRGFQAGEIARL